MGNNWYCNLAVTGNPTEIEGLRKVLNELWCRVEIREIAAAREEEALACSEPPEAPMAKTERAQARAELAQQIQDTCEKLAASSPIAGTQDRNRS